MVQDDVTGPLKAVLEGERGVRFAFLFGSRALGTARGDSDVDVAFMPTEDWSLQRELALQSALERAVGRSVDLVRLDRVSLLVAWEVVRSGRPLCGDSKELSAFRTAVALEHADAAPLLGWAARRYAALVAAHGTGP